MARFRQVPQHYLYQGRTQKDGEGSSALESPRPFRRSGMRLHGALEQRAHARQVCTVRQEQFYLAGSVTNEGRIAALKEDCALKKDSGHSAVIGFAA